MISNLAEHRARGRRRRCSPPSGPACHGAAAHQRHARQRRRRAGRRRPGAVRRSSCDPGARPDGIGDARARRHRRRRVVGALRPGGSGLPAGLQPLPPVLARGRGRSLALRAARRRVLGRPRPDRRARRRRLGGRPGRCRPSCCACSRRATSGSGARTSDCSARRCGSACGAWLGGVAHLLNARVDQVLMGLIASQAALGTYAVAVNASEVLFYLPSAVGTALLPVVARASGDGGRGQHAARVPGRDDRHGRRRRCWPRVTGPLLLPLVFGAAYAGSVRAVPVAAAQRLRVRRQRRVLERAARLRRARPVVARTRGITGRRRDARPAS